MTLYNEKKEKGLMLTLTSESLAKEVVGQIRSAQKITPIIIDNFIHRFAWKNHFLWYALEAPCPGVLTKMIVVFVNVLNSWVKYIQFDKILYPENSPKYSVK